MPESSQRLRVIVMGYLVRGPMGGMAWHHLQYVMGLAALGHDVYYLEDSDDYTSCYDPTRNVVDTDPSYGLAFTEDAFRRVGLADRWAYFDAHTSRWLGPRGDMPTICKSADMLINVSGVNPLRSWLDPIDLRVLIDTDPAFTQIKHLTEPPAFRRAQQHNSFFTFGENFGRAGCTVPDDGLPWKATRQPVVLDAWPVTPGNSRGDFTTVMQWDSYPAREYGGQTYGMKSASFQPYRDLPSRTGESLQLALGAPAPREELREAGWSLIEPLTTTRDPWKYQGYLQQSKGEFSLAKQGYVATNSGWFSERSAAYLASGRPVLVQDTGFAARAGIDRGALVFRSPEDAVAGLEEIDRHYASHCEAARMIAAEHFDAARVLDELIDVAACSGVPASTD